MTVRELTLRMGERELARWQRYAVQRGFPSQRAQLQAALTSLIVARTMGGSSESTLSDFLIQFDAEERKPAPAPTAQDGAAMFGAMAGRRVRVLGQKKRKG